MEWKKYKRKGLSEMRPYTAGEDVSHVSISEPDKQNGSPKIGDMIARNPKNHEDQWLVAQKYFEDNLEPANGDTGNEMLLLAKLAADTPQFFNPLEAVAAKKLRDDILSNDQVQELSGASCRIHVFSVWD